MVRSSSRTSYASRTVILLMTCYRKVATSRRSCFRERCAGTSTIGFCFTGIRPWSSTNLRVWCLCAVFHTPVTILAYSCDLQAVRARPNSFHAVKEPHGHCSDVSSGLKTAQAPRQGGDRHFWRGTADRRFLCRHQLSF